MCHGANADDAPLPGCQHPLSYLLTVNEFGRHQIVDCVIHVRQLDLFRLPELGRSRHVHQDVDPAELSVQQLEYFHHLRSVPNAAHEIADSLSGTHCFDKYGNNVWEQTLGLASRDSDAPHSPWPGARGAPTINGEIVYLLSGLGELNAYRTRNGELRWSVDVVKNLGGRVPPWGYTESVLIDGDNLICTPGSEIKGTFAALNRKTGQVAWQSAGITGRAECGSPILIEYDGVRQVVTMSRAGLVAMSPGNGKFLSQSNRMAKTPMAESNTAHGNSAAFDGGYVFEATNYHTRGGSAVRFKSNAFGLRSELVWESNKLNCEHGGYVILDGHIYINQGVGRSCLDLKTGKERWFGRSPGKGSIIYADGMLFCLGEQGTVGLTEAKPEAFRIVSKFDLPAGDGPCWTHPVIANQKPYLQWGDKLYHYELTDGTKFRYDHST
jgi:outer membrane protein assembly factor BamB